jgi:hypothetical protein
MAPPSLIKKPDVRVKEFVCYLDEITKTDETEKFHFIKAIINKALHNFVGVFTYLDSFDQKLISLLKECGSNIKEMTGYALSVKESLSKKDLESGKLAQKLMYFAVGGVATPKFKDADQTEKLAWISLNCTPELILSEYAMHMYSSQREVNSQKNTIITFEVLVEGLYELDRIVGVLLAWFTKAATIESMEAAIAVKQEDTETELVEQP